MPRVRVIVDQTWQEINGALACVITCDQINKKVNLEFDETANTNTALKVLASPNVQIIQNEDKSVWVRSDTDGYELIVDISTPT